MNTKYNYKRGMLAMAACYLFWGFQPLYWALDDGVDTTFLLATRILWAAVVCLVILGIQGKLGQLAEAFRSREVRRREIPASLLLLADWSIYLFAIRAGQIQQCSLGYYIMPLVMFALGAVIYRENVTWKHLAILALVVIGICLSVQGFGGFPWVTAALAVCFAVYSAVKKSLSIDSIVSTTMEILLMTPLALLYILLFGRGAGGLADLTLVRQLFLIGGGLVTGLPMVFFSLGVRHLPLTMSGMCQYLSPTLGLICSRILGESLTAEKLLSFAFVWLGVLLYLWMAFHEIRAEAKQNQS